MHNSASVRENETHKLFGYFKIQTDYRISAKRPNLIIIHKKKRTCRFVDFAVLDGHRVKLKKLWNMKVIILPILISALGTVTKELIQGLEDLEITRRVGAIQDTEKSPGDLR